MAEVLGMGHKLASSAQQMPRSQGHHQAPTGGHGRFLLPVSECEFALESALEDLTVSMGNSKNEET